VPFQGIYIKKRGKNMTTQWENAAASLRKDIQDRALAEFLQYHDVAEIADAASASFRALDENEQASVIATLAAQISGNETNGMSISSVLALDGRIFATLTPGERELLMFYKKVGRKYGVVVNLGRDPSHDGQHYEIMRQSNTPVSVQRQTSE
jgi:hypothetical protein